MKKIDFKFIIGTIIIALSLNACSDIWKNNLAVFTNPAFSRVKKGLWED
jgi:hypothetical protein